jgi:sortase (surface protein transpeptidase)
VLGIGAALLAAVARFRGAAARRVIPAAGAGCMVAIAAAGLLIAGSRGDLPTPAGATATPHAAAPPATATLTHPQTSKPATTRRQQTRQPSAVTGRGPAPQATPPAPPVSAGMRIQIPAIGVDAGVVKLGLNTDSTLQVPSTPSDAGWWSGGTRPGEVGPAVIVGHVNWGGVTGVFGRLGDLRKGEQVLIRRPDGAVDRYVVTGSAVYPKSSFPTKAVYGTIGYAGLRLITCTGGFDSATGHYVDNLIVFARMTGRSASGSTA